MNNDQGKRHRLQVFLVHGTWGRGLPLPRRRRIALWCEEGSSFFQALQRHLDLAGYDCEIISFNWSGANSIFKRDKAAHELSSKLLSFMARDQGSRKVVVGHSHGGNVALRALHLCHKSRLLSVNDSPISVATIATSFLRLTNHDPRPDQYWSPELFRIVVLILIILAALSGVWHIMISGSPNDYRTGLMGSFLLLVGLLVLQLLDRNVWDRLVKAFNSALHGGYEAHKARVRSRKRPALLAEASYYPPVSTQGGGVLVIRGTEDEASMVLTLGSMGVRASDIISAIFLRFIPIMGCIIVPIIGFSALESQAWPYAISIIRIAFYFGLSAAIAFLFASLAKGVFGRELIWRSTRLTVCANSAPDVLDGGCRIITLDRNAQDTSSLLHSLYDHPACAGAIADWISRSG